jgi:hypothetical protein
MVELSATPSISLDQPLVPTEIDLSAGMSALISSEHGANYIYFHGAEGSCMYYVGNIYA